MQPTNFDAFEHAQLVANVQPIQPESVDGFRQEWARAANGVADVFATLAATIGRAIADRWQGASGAAAAAAIAGYARDANGMADASNLVARQIGLLVDSLDRTKLDLPPEPAETVPGRLAGLVGADGWDDERRDAARQQAVHFLDTVYYGGGIVPTAQGLPVFPAVNSPIAGGPGPVSGGSTAESAGGGRSVSSSEGSAGSGDDSSGVGSGTYGSSYSGAGTTGWGSGAGDGSMVDSNGGSTELDERGYGGSIGADEGSAGEGSAGGATTDAVAVPGSDTGAADRAGAAGVDRGSNGVGSGTDAAASDSPGKTVAADYGPSVGSGAALPGTGTCGTSSGVGPPGAGSFTPGAPGVAGLGSGVSGGDRIPGGSGSGALGSPLLGGVAPGAGATGRSPTAVPGRPGYPGMGMAPLGGRGNGDDDRGRTAPDYLANDELRQWIARQAGRWGTPVIGAVTDVESPDDPSGPADR
ncbi:hypothetical protein [Skermania piniformis]|uniref:PPE domain-containing protein n=1 Tax=Skermania pinensis TaxID=39122 RepID=A0ABX8SAQ0_9ACTN|nr:hypothetical protein [Skermania piniformis]QXQ12796.1 hypothetical protein KV203_12745 [Skermania piniformis]